MKHQDNNLILIVEDDPVLCRNIATFLRHKGFQTIEVHDGLAGIDAVASRAPALAVVDLHMPVLDGQGFLREIRKNGSHMPVIITTGSPDMDSVIEVIHNGAQDYIVKPYHLADLYSKVDQILTTLHKHRKSELLSELVEIHSISNRLAASSTNDDVLDVTFTACLQAVDSEHGYLMLFDEEEAELSLVRAVGEYHGSEITTMDSNDDWPEAKWVCRHNRTLTVINGVSDVPELDEFSQRIEGTMVITPLRAGDQVVGVVCTEGLSKDHLHSQLNRSLLEILAAQAGTAIKNAGLYHTLNRRISDLNFIAEYAEQFVGIVDPADVLLSFLDTITSYFDVAYVGVLLLKKRFHSFMHWSNFKDSDELDKEVAQEAIELFNQHSNTKISINRVKFSSLESNDHCVNEPVEELTYSHEIPLIWSDFEFGSLILKWKKKPDHIEDNNKLLRGIINQTRFALTNAKLYADIKENYLRTIKALAIAVDAKDTYTHGHSENVMRYSEILAHYLGLDHEEIELIKNGGLLHDIGKIGIPGVILNKPTKLTDEEFNGVMKTHPTLGANIIKDVPFLQDLNPIILYHHENYDGTGYPLGLAGEKIPFNARIVHIADAYEAMTSNRPYRKGLGEREAVRRLRENAGTQFDPVMVEQFIDAMVQARAIAVEDTVR